MVKLMIIGAGGHGQAVAEAAELSGQYVVVGFLDDAYPTLQQAMGYPIMGTIADAAALMAEYEGTVVAIGNNANRERITLSLLAKGIDVLSVAHPSSHISPRARLGQGVVVMAGAVVGTYAVLGDGVIVNAGAVVDHNCTVDAYAHLGTGANMAGGTKLGKAAWMQAGSALKYNEYLLPGQVIAR